MISKLPYKVVAFSALVQLATIAMGAPSGPDLDQEHKVEHLAVGYKIDGKEAAEKFKALRQFDGKKAGDAAVYFAKAKAYEIAALALPETKDEGARTSLRNLMTQKKNFNPTVCQAALRELELLNEEDLGHADGEHIAGVANVKETLAEAIARWLTMAVPKLPHDPDQSAAGYKVFIAEAKRKAATITVSSPD